MKTSGLGPLVSVIMANFQAGDKIVAALRSVLGQTLTDLEVIVSDDASRDHSPALVRTMMETDPRIRLVTSDTNAGPAPCRNRALAVARGRWIAIVDSDDIIHPERFERLLAVATLNSADIVADDQLLFHEDGSPPKLMLGEQSDQSFDVSSAQWVLAGLDGSPALGYLKPMIRADLIGDHRYDEALRIGEDYDLILRLLLDGARMTVVAEPFYLYRRHSASISHRLSSQDVQAMIDHQVALTAKIGTMPPKLAAAFVKRLAKLQQGQAYERLVAYIKRAEGRKSGGMLLRNPALFLRLFRSFWEGVTRRRNDPSTPKITETLVLCADNAPAYVPSHLVDWSAPRPRTIWRDLAKNAGSRCIALDQAGRYAAGFIPEVVMEVPDIVRVTP